MYTALKHRVMENNMKPEPIGLPMGSSKLSLHTNKQHRLLPWHVEVMFKDVMGRNADFNSLRHQAFTKDLKIFLHWMEEIRKEASGWIKPAENLLCLRIQLEKHLTFAMQIDRHQPEKDLLVQQAQDISDTIPSLLPYLEEILSMIEAQWEELQSQIDRQYQEIETELNSADYVVGNYDQVTNPTLAEYNRDTKDQLAMRLHCGKRKSSPMQISISSHNRQMECFNNDHKLEMTGSGSSHSSDTGFFEDFEKEYQELVDWLSEVQLVLTDNESETFTSKQRLTDIYKGTEVSRVEESGTEKQQHLLTVYPNLTSEITDKLTDLNHKWNYNMDQTNDCHGNHQSVMLRELEEILVALRMWLNDVERKLFTGQKVKHSTNVEEIERRLQEHQDLQEDIEKHARSVTSLLTLCNILQDDSRACPSERDSDALQLSAINLDRRWQAILIQSIDFQCKLEEKLFVLRGPLYNLDKDVAVEVGLEPVQSGHQGSDIASPNSRSVNASSDAPGTKMIDGLLDYGYDQDAPVPGSDLVPVRKAFSENDAFSISDASDISLDDFTFDDMYQLKDHEEVSSVAGGDDDRTFLQEDTLDISGNLPFETYLSHGPAEPAPSLPEAFQDLDNVRKARELAARRQRGKERRKGKDRLGSLSEVEGHLGHSGSSPNLHVVPDGGPGSKRKLQECLSQEDTLEGKKQARAVAPFFSDNFEEIFDIEDIEFVEFDNYPSAAPYAGRPPSGLTAQIVGAEAEFPDSFNAVTEAVDQAILQLGSSPKDDSDLRQLMATYIDPDVTLDGQAGSGRVWSGWRNPGTGSGFKQPGYGRSFPTFDPESYPDVPYVDSHEVAGSLKTWEARGPSKPKLGSGSPAESLEESSSNSSGAQTTCSVIHVVEGGISASRSEPSQPLLKNQSGRPRKEGVEVEDSCCSDGKEFNSCPPLLGNEEKENQFQIRKPSFGPAKFRSSGGEPRVFNYSAMSLAEPVPSTVNDIPLNSMLLLQSTPNKKEGQPLSLPSPSTPAMWPLLKTPDKPTTCDQLSPTGQGSRFLPPPSPEMWSLTTTPKLRIVNDSPIRSDEDNTSQLASPLDVSHDSEDRSFSLLTKEAVELTSTLSIEGNSQPVVPPDVNLGKDSEERFASTLSSPTCKGKLTFYSSLSELVGSCLSSEEKPIIKLDNTKLDSTSEGILMHTVCIDSFKPENQEMAISRVEQQQQQHLDNTKLDSTNEGILTHTVCADSFKPENQEMAISRVEQQHQQHLDSADDQDWGIASAWYQDWDLPELAESYLDLPSPRKARVIDTKILDQKNESTAVLDGVGSAENLDQPTVSDAIGDSAEKLDRRPHTSDGIQSTQQDSSDRKQVSTGVSRRVAIGEGPFENVSINVRVNVDDKDADIETQVNLKRGEHLEPTPTGVLRDRVAGEKSESLESMAENNTPHSFLYRVLRIAIPLHLLLMLFVFLVVVLPVIVEQSNGDCSFYFADLYLNKLLLEPVLRYVSGRPPL